MSPVSVHFSTCLTTSIVGTVLSEHRVHSQPRVLVNVMLPLSHQCLYLLPVLVCTVQTTYHSTTCIVEYYNNILVFYFSFSNLFSPNLSFLRLLSSPLRVLCCKIVLSTMLVCVFVQIFKVELAPVLLEETSRVFANIYE